MPAINKVISGGQSGCDVLGLEVAKKLGIQTGGTAPKGFRTENGPAPWLAEYGLVEHSSPDYPPRTEVNVQDSDGTVWFGDETNAGGKLTIRLVQKHQKPILINPTALSLKTWLEFYDIKILNVAGNRGSKLSPADLQKYRDILTKALQ